MEKTYKALYATICLFAALILVTASGCKKEENRGLSLDAKSGRLFSSETNMTYADGPYHYSISGTVTDGDNFNDTILTKRRIKKEGNETIITGKFSDSGLDLWPISATGPTGG